MEQIRKLFNDIKKLNQQIASHLVDYLTDIDPNDEIAKELLTTIGLIQKVYTKMYALTYGVGINARTESNTMNHYFDKVYNNHKDQIPEFLIDRDFINYIENTFNKEQGKNYERI